MRNHARNHNLRLLDLAQNIINADPSSPTAPLDLFPSSKVPQRKSR